MNLEHLNNGKPQLCLIPTLAHPNDGTLQSHLKLFLLTCQVNNLSPRSIADYSQKIGAFITFCQREGISQLGEINTNHIRFSLLDIQQRCKPVSVHDYYGCVNRFLNWLIEEGVIEQNPMSRMHPPKVPKELVKPVKSQEIRVSENPLVSKLRSIPTGISNWYDYQKVCQEILDYCLIPPLLEPYGELTNQAGIHRRDIVYAIPGGVMGFWGYIQHVYSATAVIVDAKNYGGELPQNEVVIVSKYFGPRKLGNFGIIISRKGPSASAKKEQIDRWVHSEEMIICLSDDDLEEMVLIKERNGKPEEILDKKIFEIRKSA